MFIFFLCYVSYFIILLLICQHFPNIYYHFVLKLIVLNSVLNIYYHFEFVEK